MAVAFAKEARALRALAHPGRLAILETLRGGPACVCHLTTILGRPQAYVSQQLAILRQAGLIGSRKDGLYAYYELTDFSMLAVIDIVRRSSGPRLPSRHERPPRIEGCDCPQCSGVSASKGEPDGH
jgi:DNA-binding transcriptional ArsR family regulator